MSDDIDIEYDDFDFEKGEPVEKVELGRAHFSFQFYSEYGPCCITHWVEAPLKKLRVGSAVRVRSKTGGRDFYARIHVVDRDYRKDEVKEHYIYAGD